MHVKGEVMKKIVDLMLTGCLAIFVGLFSLTPLTSAASVHYTLYIDGKVAAAQLPTVVENNITLIPMKAVLTELNYTMAVDSKTKAITARNSAGSFITVKTGSKKATINGSEVLLPALVKTMNGTTYIPLSAIRNLTGQSIGTDASWGIAWIGDKPITTDVTIPWGISPDEVKALFSDKLLIDEVGQDDIYILQYQVSPEGDEGISLFYKNKLAKVGYASDISDLDGATLVGVYAGMFDSLAKRYGDPVTGSDAPNLDTIDQYIVHFANKGYLSSDWKVGDTKITLLLKVEGTGYVASLQYVDMNVEKQVDAALDAIK
jgi:hypothetical protein